MSLLLVYLAVTTAALSVARPDALSSHPDDALSLILAAVEALSTRLPALPLRILLR